MKSRLILTIVLSFVITLTVCSCSNPLSEDASDRGVALYRVQVGGKFGYIDKKGRVVIPAKFDSAEPFSEGLAAVQLNYAPKGAWGYIDQQGHEVIPPRFSEAGAFSNGLALTNMESPSWEEMVYIDKSGKIAITTKQFETDRIAHVQFKGPFSEGLAIVQATVAEAPSKDGYINTGGKLVIPFQFDNAYNFNEGVAQVVMYDLGVRTGLIERSGRLVSDLIDLCPNLFAGELQFSEGYAAAKKDCFATWGAIDRFGKFAIEPKSASLNVFREDLAIVGFEVPGAPPREKGNYFAGVQLFGDWGAIYPDLNYGYVHKSGTIVISPQFQGAGVFSEGLAAVMLRGKCGYIDKTGRLVIPARFDAAHPFSGGLANVAVGNRWGYIDESGKYVWNPTN